MNEAKHKLEHVITKIVRMTSGKSSHKKEGPIIELDSEGDNICMMMGHPSHSTLNFNLYMKMFIHELRTPISTISMGLELLGTGTKKRADEQEIIRDLKESIVFIENIFSKFAVIHEDSIVLNVFSAFSLENMTSQVVRLLEYHLNEPCITFQCVIDPDVHPWNDGDEHNLIHCLLNLLKNAIKYRSLSGTTYISLHIRRLAAAAAADTAELRQQQPHPPPLEKKPSRSRLINNTNMYWRTSRQSDMDSTDTPSPNQTVSITVNDNNPPILPHIKKRLFESFNSTSGSGMGLYICKNIVTLHGGTISHDFTSEGNQFTIVLPLTMCPDPGPSGNIPNKDIGSLCPDDTRAGQIRAAQSPSNRTEKTG